MLVESRRGLNFSNPAGPGKALLPERFYQAPICTPENRPALVGQRHVERIVGSLLLQPSGPAQGLHGDFAIRSERQRQFQQIPQRRPGFLLRQYPFPDRPTQP